MTQTKSAGRSPFNPAGLNKAVECFGGTSDKQTRHVQSLADVLMKIVLKHDVNKTVGTRLFSPSLTIYAKRPGYKPSTIHSAHVCWQLSTIQLILHLSVDRHTYMYIGNLPPLHPSLSPSPSIPPFPLPSPSFFPPLPSPSLPASQGLTSRKHNSL